MDIKKITWPNKNQNFPNFNQNKNYVTPKNINDLKQAINNNANILSSLILSSDSTCSIWKLVSSHTDELFYLSSRVSANTQLINYNTSYITTLCTTFDNVCTVFSGMLSSYDDIKITIGQHTNDINSNSGSISEIKQWINNTKFVNTINNLAGNITLNSENSNLIITKDNNKIKFKVNDTAACVNSLNNKNGSVWIKSQTPNLIDISTSGNNIMISAAPVISFNGIKTINEVFANTVGNIQINAGAGINITSDKKSSTLTISNQNPISNYVKSINANQSSLTDDIIFEAGQNMFISTNGNKIIFNASTGGSADTKIVCQEVPIGTIMYWTGSQYQYPEGWLVCDGTTFDIRIYSELYEILGTNILPKLTDNRFIKGSTSAGITEEAGLPNIIGDMVASDDRSATLGEKPFGFSYMKCTGAFIKGASTQYIHAGLQSRKSYYGNKLKFNAASSNAIYGKSTTVTPANITQIPIIKAKNTKSAGTYVEKIIDENKNEFSGQVTLKGQGGVSVIQNSSNPSEIFISGNLGSTAGVTSLNGKTGIINIEGGSGIVISGQYGSNNIKIGVKTSQIVPVGTIIAIPYNIDMPATSGYLYCNGSQVPADYIALSNLLYGCYGVGVGGRSLLPDLRDRVLQGVGNITYASGQINAGLPNILGSFNGGFDANCSFGFLTPSCEGAFYQHLSGNNSFLRGEIGGVPQKSYSIGFAASKSNSIYGMSNTVQPPAVVVRFYMKW